MTNELTQLTPQQRGWIGMATLKNALVENLTKLSLAAQQVLLNEAKTITEREQQLKDYRAAANAISEARLCSEFLKRLRSVQDELMQYEKQADYKTNEKYKTLEAELLQLKKDEQAKAEAAAAHQREAAQYRAHVLNQIEHIVSDFRVRAWQEINVMYKQAIATKDKGLIEPTIATINSMTFIQPVKFNAISLSVEERKEIAASITPPDIAKLRTEMVNEARAIWEQYDHDVAAQITPDLQAKANEVQREAEQNAAINTITAEVTVPEIVPEGKALKKVYSIESVNTQEWFTAVITNFLKYPEAASKLKNRKWSSVTAEQMAAALAALCTDRNKNMNFPGLTVKEEDKL